MTVTIADVAEFQQTINWAAYGAQSPAAIVRVHNSNRADFFATANIAGARAHCRWRGWYQYLNAGADPVAAAHAFQATLGPTLPGEVMIVDIEEGTGDQTGRRAAWLSALQDPVEWTYSGAAFARAHLGGQVDWIAAYGQAEPADPHTLWQFTDKQNFAGIATPCDGSVYSGTIDQLIALTQGVVQDMTPAESALLTYVAKIIGVALDTKGQIIQGEALTRIRSIDSHTVSQAPSASDIASAVLAKMPPATLTLTAANIDALSTAVAAKVVVGATAAENAAAVRSVLALQPLH
jgi:hypothetical protein